MSHLIAFYWAASSHSLYCNFLNHKIHSGETVVIFLSRSRLPCSNTNPSSVVASCSVGTLDRILAFPQTSQMLTFVSERSYVKLIFLLDSFTRSHTKIRMCTDQRVEFESRLIFLVDAKQILERQRIERQHTRWIGGANEHWSTVSAFIISPHFRAIDSTTSRCIVFSRVEERKLQI